MFLPSHLYTGSGSGSDKKVPAPTGSGSGSSSGSATLHRTHVCYKKNRSNGSQTTANGLATITAIFMTPNSPLKVFLKIGKYF